MIGGQGANSSDSECDLDEVFTTGKEKTPQGERETLTQTKEAKEGYTLFRRSTKLARTPNKSIDNPGKRPRTNSSPGDLATMVADLKQQEKEEEYMNLLAKEIENITKSIEREANSKISFTRADQQAIRKAGDRIMQLSIEVVEKNWKLERENMELKAKGEKMEEKVLGYKREIKQLKERLNKVEEKQVKETKKMREDIEEIKQIKNDMRDMEKRIEDKVLQMIKDAAGAQRQTKTQIQQKTATQEINTTSQTYAQVTYQGQAPAKKRAETTGLLPSTTRTNLTRNRRRSNSTSSTGSGQQSEPEWTTPKIHRRWETIVRMDQESNPDTVLAEVKKTLKPSDINGGVKNIRKLKGGGIIIEAKTEDQKTKIIENLKNRKDIEVRNMENTDPMLMLTGIEGAYKEEELLDEIIRQNEDMVTLWREDEIRKRWKFITKRRCRNERKNNWIFQIKGDLFKWIMKKGHLNIDLVCARVEEYRSLAMCFKCCGFGHVAKYCGTRQLCCHRCGGDHDGRECMVNRMECPNCVKMGFGKWEHSARDQNCPSFKRKLEIQKGYINYNG